MSDHTQKHLLIAYALQVGLTQRDLVSYALVALETPLEAWLVSSSMKEERKENIRENSAKTSMQVIEDVVEKGYLILLR